MSVEVYFTVEDCINPENTRYDWNHFDTYEEAMAAIRHPDLQMERDADPRIPSIGLHPATSSVRQQTTETDRHPLDRIHEGGT